MKRKLSATLLTIVILVIGFCFTSVTYAGEIPSLLLKKDPQVIIKSLEILIPEFVVPELGKRTGLESRESTFLDLKTFASSPHW